MAPKQHFNDYKIVGDHAEVYLKQRNGGTQIALVDLDTLQRLIAFDHVWNAKDEHGRGYYMACAIYWTNIRYTKTYYLHNFILPYVPGMERDHANQNKLDNRRSNLRYITHRDNSLNRRANKNSRSGIRNVSWISSENCWAVQFMINGRNRRVAKSYDLAEAGRLADKYRKIYYPDSL